MFPGKCAKNLNFFSKVQLTMEKANNSYKQQILHDVQMDTQTTFMNNGDINIYPCSWEFDKAPVTADGKPMVRYRAGVMVVDDGTAVVKRFRDGLNGPKYETIFETPHGAVKITRPQIGHSDGYRRLSQEFVYVMFKFPKKYGVGLTKALFQEESDEVMSYLKTRKEEAIWK